ncbi:hypothetical protein M758_2G039500 [Ceratodon purpureus]|nr:hypothetical protein M758_2G039500 [Ceratodon purpureus]
MGRELSLAHGQEIMQSGNSIDTAAKPEDMLLSIVESGIEQVPPEFIKPPHERVSRLDSEGPHEQIPVIDLAMLDDKGAGKRQVLAEIVRACEEWGCFHLINHGVPAQVMDAAMDATKRFFALPAVEREKYRMTKIGGKGYGQAYVGKAKDWNDRLFLTDFSGEEEPNPDRGCAFSYDLVLTNPPGAQEALASYGEAMHKLVQITLALLSEALGQTPEFLSSKLPSLFGTVLTHYPPCPQPDLVMGLAPHEDGGIFTFLQQSNVLGLEVLKDGRWVPVQPVAHAFVFMVADLVQIVSNDRFKSVTHRALAGPIARTVMANFTATVKDAVIQPAPELCSDRNPPAFRSVVYKEFLKYLGTTDLHVHRLEAFRLRQ